MGLGEEVYMAGKEPTGRDLAWYFLLMLGLPLLVWGLLADNPIGLSVGIAISAICFISLLIIPPKRKEKKETGQGGVISSATLGDLAAIPRDVMDIIGDYGRVLENLGSKGRLLQLNPPGSPKAFSGVPVSLLPHPKEKIENALKTALEIAKDQEMRSSLKHVLIALKLFIPDGEIPKDPVEPPPEENPSELTIEPEICIKCNGRLIRDRVNNYFVCKSCGAIHTAQSILLKEK